MQEKIRELIEFWGSTFKNDGIYLKNFDKIQYKNTYLLKNFIEKTRRFCNFMYIAIIGDYSEEDSLKNTLYDIYRVDLNSIEIYNSLKQNISSNVFESYLNRDKKCLWSLENLDLLPYHVDSRRSLFIGFYSIMYSLPGIVSLRQGDELEYERTSPKNYSKIFRWNDLENQSGFSLNNTENLIWLRVNLKQQTEITNQTNLLASQEIAQ